MLSHLDVTLFDGQVDKMLIDSRELAWAAGLFDGEGTIHLTKTSKPRMSLTMSDEDSVRRFHNAVNVGNVSGPRLPKDGNKEVWEWNAGKFQDVQHAVASLWYGLCNRRKAKCAEVLTSVQYHDWSVCREGHSKTGSNAFRRSNGTIECRECRNKKKRDAYRLKVNLPMEKYRCA